MEKEFNPDRIKRVPVFDVYPNDYNPKRKDTAEYEQVRNSIDKNGFKQPIIVRQVDGEYIIVDGEQRYNAAIDLGYNEIYIYDLGEISEEEAKSLTLWFEVQVPFDKISLAPIALELNQISIETPFTDKEMMQFKKVMGLEPAEPKPEQNEGDFKTLKIRMASDQFDTVKQAIDIVSKNENVSEGRALELLVADGMSGYMQINYIPENGE